MSSPDAEDEQIPEIARACLSALGDQLHRIKALLLVFDRRIGAWHRSCEASRRPQAQSRSRSS